MKMRIKIKYLIFIKMYKKIRTKKNNNKMTKILDKCKKFDVWQNFKTKLNCKKKLKFLENVKIIEKSLRHFKNFGLILKSWWFDRNLWKKWPL